MTAISLLEMSPVIAAVKDEKGLKRCFDSDCQIVFILYGNLCTIGRIVQDVKAHGKMAIVHADLALGMSPKEIAIDYIKESTCADGIISTKPQLVRRATELGLFGVLRTFIVDSMAINTIRKQIDTYHPNMIEVMPGIMPKVLTEFRKFTDIAIIAGGLITDKKDIIDALSAGANAISTTKEELWFV